MFSYFSVRVASSASFPIYSMFFVRWPRSFVNVSNLSSLDNTATMNIETITVTTTMRTSVSCWCTRAHEKIAFCFFDYDGYSLAAEQNFQHAGYYFTRYYFTNGRRVSRPPSTCLIWIATYFSLDPFSAEKSKCDSKKKSHNEFLGGYKINYS